MYGMTAYNAICLSDFYGEGLKHRREEAGMTREELAAEAGVSKWSINNYENGHRKPSIDIAVKMYNILNARLDKKMYPYGRFE